MLKITVKNNNKQTNMISKRKLGNTLLCVLVTRYMYLLL